MTPDSPPRREWTDAHIGYTQAVLDLYADGVGDAIMWLTDGEYAPVTFFADCRNLFQWSIDDYEPITIETISALHQAFADAMAAYEYGGDFATALFCARQRHMRPQQAVYRRIPKELWPLFDACGPDPRGRTR